MSMSVASLAVFKQLRSMCWVFFGGMEWMWSGGVVFLGGSQQKLHFVSTLRTKKSDGTL